jgi:hypothetical protein
MSVVSGSEIQLWYFSQQKKICLKLINSAIDEIGLKTELLGKLSKRKESNNVLPSISGKENAIRSEIETTQDNLRLYLKRLQLIEINLGSLNMHKT